MKRKFIISGGGTGGHIFPAIALKRTIAERRSCEIKFVGSDKAIDRRIFEKEGVSFSLLSANKLPYKISPSAILFFIKLFLDLDVKIFCIDVAHGDHKLCVDMCKYISKMSPDCLLIAGNVATASGALRLWDAGAILVKCAVGNGSLCSTRIEAASGVPQFTVISDVAEVKPKDKYFISDGGMRFAGDFAKALCFSDMVMTGNVFAGCDECPGNIISINGVAHKEFSGSSTHKTNHIEGVKAMVPVKGKAQNILTKILEGIQSACSYQGVDNLTDLKENPTFIKITNAGFIESHPHNVWKIDS